MNKLILSTGLLMLANITTQASNEPKLVKSFEWYEYGDAVDSQGNTYTLFLERINEHDAKFTIVYSDLTVLKEFTLRDAFLVNESDPYRNEIAPIAIGGQLCNGNSCSDVYATQGVYNDDDKWEVIIRYGEDDYKVINEDNEFVCVPLPENSQDTQWSFAKNPAGFYYNDIDKVFYIKQYLIDDTGYYGYAFYTYSTKHGSVASPSVQKHTGRAYPNPLPTGHTLTIELNEPAGTGTTVEIADINGRVLLSQPVAASAEKVTVPSRNIHRGNLIYSVKRDGEIVESGKIIAY